MQWIYDNWFWILLIGGMIAMHLFGHGGHGGHGSSSDNGAKTEPAATPRVAGRTENNREL